VEGFVTNNQKWQNTLEWRSLLLPPPQQKRHWDKPSGAFSKMDRMSSRVKYSLIQKVEGWPLDIGNESEEMLCFIAKLTFERVRHHVELAAYHDLQKELDPGKKNIETMRFLGMVLLSLRRRIAICKDVKIWKHLHSGPLADESIYPPAVRSMEDFCFQLYFHFFRREKKMSPSERNQVREKQTFIHPHTGTPTMEYLPIGESRDEFKESRDGFNAWMEEGEILYRAPRQV
jgi:hypothetical protein